jgi:parvulin-like peptidyl-prolyl isomerase
MPGRNTTTLVLLTLLLALIAVPSARAADPPDSVQRPSLYIAQAADSDVVAAEVAGATINLGEVNRRLDVEVAVLTLQGDAVPDLTDEANAVERQRRQRQMAEQLVDERVVANRAAVDGVTVNQSEVEEDVARLAADVGIAVEEVASALADLGADMGVLRQALAAAHLVGRFAQERIVTGANPEHINDYERWIAVARQAANARVLLPNPPGAAPRG